MLVTLTVVGLMGAFAASTALADPHPINGSTRGELVTNPNGTVTVYIRGEWNWLALKSDCNEVRAGAGAGLIWNDPTEPGYVLSHNGVTVSIGVSSLRPGDTSNVIDGMIHPVDRGNVPQGFTAPPGFPAGQLFNDPAPQASGQPQNVAEWKGGCGREPLMGPGAGQFEGFPWGSWGFEKQTLGSDGKMHIGYAHTYPNRGDVSQVCINMYDVHGGGKPGQKNFQVPAASSEIDVLQNGDNNIMTNSFNFMSGSCLSTFEEPNFNIKKEQRIHGSGLGYTTATLGAEVGQTVEYLITVANTGNTKLKFGPLSDPKCTNLHPSGTTELSTGETETFTCEHVLVAGDKPEYSNTATIEGGGKPKESNKVVVTVPAQGVKAECTISEGAIVLKGVGGSRRHTFTVHIGALGIKRITFFVDGHRIKTLTSRQAKNGEFSVRIHPRRYGFGHHTVSVKTVMESSECANIARSGVFIRPRPPAIIPKFTG